MLQVMQKREELALLMILHGQFPSQGWTIQEDFYWEVDPANNSRLVWVKLTPVPPRAVLRLPDKSKQQ